MNKKYFNYLLLAFFLVFAFGFVLAAQGGNQNPQGNSSNQNTNGSTQQIQEQNRTQVRDGTHLNVDGIPVKVQKQENNRIRIESSGIFANCDCEMEQVQEQNRTRFYAKLSNGQNAEVKIMPDTASQTALERLRLRVCSEENNCTIELKEVGKSDNETQFAYEVQIQRHSRILGIFGSKMQVRAEVSAENGEVLSVDKPWWAFLASEPAEE